MMTLYDYYRSSSSYRVRIALHLKKIPFKTKSVHLTKDGGQQFEPAYVAVNPQQRVPTLVDGSHTMTQSMAILEYLEAQYPRVPLLPKTPEACAYVRALVQLIACDMQPLNNLSVLRYLENELGANDDQRQAWYAHWVQAGFNAFEALLLKHSLFGQGCFGDEPTLADVLLVPQVYNARRYDVDLSACPTVMRLAEHLESLPAFAAAHPDVLA